MNLANKTVPPTRVHRIQIHIRMATTVAVVAMAAMAAMVAAPLLATVFRTIGYRVHAQSGYL